MVFNFFLPKFAAVICNILTCYHNSTMNRLKGINVIKNLKNKIK